MKKFLFDDFHQWKVCMKSGLDKFCWGLWRMLTGIFFGIVSILVYCGKQIEAFCRREPIAATIIFVIIACLSVGWISTFVLGRSRLMLIQHQRDSISIKLDRYLQAYDTTDIIVVKGDTIQNGL